MSTNTLSIQLLYWNEYEGLVGKYLGMGQAYPFSLGWYCHKRMAYILHPQFSDKPIYQQDHEGKFMEESNPFWFRSKKAYEKLYPGWSNYYKVSIQSLDNNDDPIDILFRFRSVEDLLHYIYNNDLFPVDSIGNAEIRFYKPDRGKRKDQFYLHKVEYYYI